MVFLGIWDRFDVPWILQKNGLIDATECGWLEDLLGVDDSYAPLLPAIRRAYRCEGKPETKVKVTGRIDFAHLLAEYTEQHKLISHGTVLDATPIATHDEGEDENTSNNNDVHD